MPAAFRSDVAEGLSCLYQFDLSGDGGGKWYVDVRNGTLEVGEGERRSPDVTILASALDYVDIAEGRRSPTLALVTGRFKIKGNLSLAMKLEKIFKR
jgi:putative sterol carrier protein